MAEIDPGPDNDYQVQSTATFSRELWNIVMASIAARLKARELLEASFETLIENGTQAALDMISHNVAPQLSALTTQINNLEAALEELIGGGTAPNALQLGGKNPDFYLALANATGTLPVEKVAGLTALVQSQIDGLKNAAPDVLDTFKEIADALGNNPNLATDVMAALSAKLGKSTNLSDLADKDAALVNLFGGAAGIQIFKRSTMAQIRTDLQIERWNRVRNRIINGDMRHDQRNQGAAVDYSFGSSGVYVLDRWQHGYASAAGGTVRIQRVVSTSPGGAICRMRHTVQAVDAVVAAGDYLLVQQCIEGIMVPDARFGTAAARPVIVRFGLRSSLPGTFGVSLRNATSDTCWVGECTVAAGEINTDLVCSFVIPGATSGAWLTDNGAGLYLTIALMAGTNFQGVTGWNAALKFSTNNQINFMATAGATFELFDVGLYVDYDATGIVPPWELPDYVNELRNCERYYQVVDLYLAGPKTAGTTTGNSVPLRQNMRTTPSAVVISNSIGVDGTVFREYSDRYVQSSFTAGSTGAFILDETQKLSAEY
ncbi:MAG: hypothetical protein QHC89_01830 [Bosea sp. (in: a-proteobacteria)]|nr:hypothetical protein [Bosea sp. (in: a-proteobacteria)]